MQECKLIWQDESSRITICVECKRVRQTTQTNLDKVHYLCKERGGEPNVLERKVNEAEIPPTFTRLKNFSLAALKHVAKGNPTCSKEEVARRFEICKSNKCGFYIPKGADKGICGHISCGCNLAAEVEYLNKLAWPEQSCPMGYWEEEKTDDSE